MPAHPLDGAMRRAIRANRYIDEADALLHRFASECEDRIVANYNPHTGYAPLNFPPVPDDLPFAISDAVHNLRAALDYIIYELALECSGSIQEGTQFPIESVKSGTSPHGNKIGFDAVAPRYLKGLFFRPHIIDAIENIQPYNGRRWTQDLRDISNPDKHRQLTPISKDGILSMWVRGPDLNGRRKPLPNGDTIEVDPTHAVTIVLPDRELLIVHTLHGIQAGAIDTINAFKPEFKV